MKNLIKALGIIGFIGASFLPMKDLKGQTILEAKNLDSNIKTASLGKDYEILLGKRSLRKDSRWYMNVKEINDPKQIFFLDSIYTIKVPRTSKDNQDLVVLYKGTKISILDTFNLIGNHVTLLYGSVKVIENPK